VSMSRLKLPNPDRRLRGCTPSARLSISCILASMPERPILLSQPIPADLVAMRKHRNTHGDWPFQLLQRSAVPARKCLRAAF
jgi:hypothetical protein